MTAPPTIECPKCFAEMHRVERSGVVVDRCTSCGGVFLDRGELEHLIQSESAYLARSSSRYDDDDRGRRYSQSLDVSLTIPAMSRAGA